MNFKTLKYAVKTSMPVILGYLPSGFAFGLMMSAIGQSVLTSFIMAVTMYAGAGQYIAVDFIKNNAAFITIIVTTFLINSKHLFYGISLIEKFNKTGKKKPYLIFALTDETYALLTGTEYPKDVKEDMYILLVSLINQLSWITGCTLGAVFGNVVKFDTTGLDFAMTALFLVILTDQTRVFRSKLPFIVGGVSALAAMLVLGKDNMLLGGAVLSVAALLILHKKGFGKNDND